MYSGGEEVSVHFAFSFATPTRPKKLKIFIAPPLPVGMPSKPKTGRREISEIKRAAILTWYKAGKSYSQISILEALPRSTVSTIVRRVQLHPQYPTANGKRAGRSRKTNP
jgi:hypothetical protein